MTQSYANPERPFRRFAEFAVLTPDDRDKIRQLAHKPVALPIGAVIREQCIEPTCIYLLIEGWASASINLKNGTQQIAKVHLPGDLMGMPSASLQETADTLTALTPVVIGQIPLERFAHLFSASPRFAMAMFLSSQRERIALMDMLTQIGRASSFQRMAWLLLDLHERLSLSGLCEPTWFNLMLLQEQIADILGITTVHANRTFRRLQRDGFIRSDRKRIEILDRRALARVANWERRAMASPPKWLMWDVEVSLFEAGAEVVGTAPLRSNA